MLLACRFLYHLLYIYTNRQPTTDWLSYNITIYSDGLGRLFSGYKHLLLLQRIWDEFSEPQGTGQLTTSCSPSPRESETLFWPPHRLLHAHGTDTDKTHTHNKIRINKSWVWREVSVVGNTCCSLSRPEFSFQYSPWGAHSCLRLQLQRKQTLLLSVGTWIHMIYTHIDT